MLDHGVRLATKYRGAVATIAAFCVLALAGFAISNTRLAAQKHVSGDNATLAKRNEGIAREAIDRLGTQMALATTLNNLGRMLTESENTNEAETVFQRAIELLGPVVDEATSPSNPEQPKGLVASSLSSRSSEDSSGNQTFVFKQNLTKPSIKGTSISTPTTVASAAPDDNPYSIVAVAIATSK